MCALCAWFVPEQYWLAKTCRSNNLYWCHILKVVLYSVWDLRHAYGSLQLRVWLHWYQKWERVNLLSTGSHPRKLEQRGCMIDRLLQAVEGFQRVYQPAFAFEASNLQNARLQGHISCVYTSIWGDVNFSACMFWTSGPKHTYGHAFVACKWNRKADDM